MADELSRDTELWKAKPRPRSLPLPIAHRQPPPIIPAEVEGHMSLVSSRSDGFFTARGSNGEHASTYDCSSFENDDACPPTESVQQFDYCHQLMCVDGATVAVLVAMSKPQTRLCQRLAQRPITPA